jgi:hypothetical protein
MPKRADDLPGWADADRISDEIVDLANREFKRGTFPLQIFGGVMLGLLGVMRSAPENRPLSMELVEVAVRECLRSMMASKRREN